MYKARVVQHVFRENGEGYMSTLSSYVDISLPYTHSESFYQLNTQFQSGTMSSSDGTDKLCGDNPRNETTCNIIRDARCHLNDYP